MNIFERMKSLLSLAEKYRNTDLYKEIVYLNDELYNLKEEIYTLKDENQKLKEISLKNKWIFRIKSITVFR